MDAKLGIELLTRVLCDTPDHSGVEGVHLFAQTEDNQQSVLRTASHLAPNLSRVCLLKTPARNGYPGFSAWERALVRGGVPEEKIEGIAVADERNLNTRVEAEALIEHAWRRGYTCLGIVAAPFHQLRAFMTSVTIATESFPELRLYSYPGAALPWDETVRHSQGTLTRGRQALIWSEWERIETYQRKGDLGSFELVLDYLQRRDARG